MNTSDRTIADGGYPLDNDMLGRRIDTTESAAPWETDELAILTVLYALTMQARVDAGDICQLTEGDCIQLAPFINTIDALDFSGFSPAAKKIIARLLGLTE